MDGFIIPTEKAGHPDHIWPVRLQLAYITKQQAFNSGFWLSILSG